MHFDWAWERLLRVKFVTEELWQHFINSNIGQKYVIIAAKLTFVLKLVEITLKSIKANYFSDAGNIKFFDLLSEI